MACHARMNTPKRVFRCGFWMQLQVLGLSWASTEGLQGRMVACHIELAHAFWSLRLLEDVVRAFHVCIDCHSVACNCLLFRWQCFPIIGQSSACSLGIRKLISLMSSFCIFLMNSWSWGMGRAEDCLPQHPGAPL